ncbi:MAG: Holliday junction DNA helicase RuvB [Candidatus Taylorbacteria bacterium RIFCSPHIGHO2_01_FULL_45_63]|uniref:Holliday junction branch migration complex subunit RuvB n=1 Tax=Candidatus Taylorbacteria bacterium RIFCSPHIGHO2_02_FULL_45_35 TaxID=1802311 RepID=A0A1G2MTV2_9BACT|nr:MAG: Holliday junction DNA helicase RuvB [Candidatus Taylorbacteria bacterium RIFCSPHIGHO2_01_FULL_45_63]OHA27144.1 MAG: Holliday junction DNA helicase RuvB [Candidatus Taylorbacteria bacterium RIFCSPHIGHO2_02_FULL_45_35]OHA33844.1 MAG: Holliday junction DNA helicase RuvB [Candidatus Taylorbacteria bacterium RIFCSPLOWO2_01_FULL_45_34b]
MSSNAKGKIRDEELQKEEHFLDKTLRPERFSDYIGQENIKDNLKILLSAAKERNHPPEHLLFYGPPGLGKTTLAHLIAKETGSDIKITSGPAILKVGDLASIITNLSPGDILFIDEIHRLNKNIEEVLYPAMESGTLNIILGKGPSARSIQLELPPFTLIAATTRIALISAPLRSRFSGGIFRLEFYTEAEIKKIIERSASILGIQAKAEASTEIAKRSRFTPRTANYLLKRCRDFVQVQKQPLEKSSVIEALQLLGIDEVGLAHSDRKILETLVEKFGGGPVGLNTLATALSEEEATVEEYNEPYLIQIGFLERTPRGRVVTERGYAHLGRKKPGQISF